MEPEFLDRARRGDHKTLQDADPALQGVRAGGRLASRSRRTGSRSPRSVTGVCCGRPQQGVAADGRARRSRSSPVHRPRTTAPASRCGRPKGSSGCVRSRSHAGPTPKAPGRSCRYLTQARTADDTTEPLTMGVFSGVIDPRERDRILCDAVIVPVKTDRWGAILDQGRATNVWNRATRRALTHRSPHCQWPGCEIPAPWCDAHHFVHWEHGGATVTRQRCPSLSKTSHLRAPTPRLDLHLRPSTVPRVPSRRQRSASRRVDRHGLGRLTPRRGPGLRRSRCVDSRPLRAVAQLG